MIRLALRLRARRRLVRMGVGTLRSIARDLDRAGYPEAGEALRMVAWELRRVRA